MAQLKDLLVNGDAKFLADVILDHDPTANLHAATKQYIDNNFAKIINVAGTSGTEGTATLTLGNSTPSGTAGNLTGVLELYDYYGVKNIIRPSTGTSHGADCTFYLPTWTGNNATSLYLVGYAGSGGASQGVGSANQPVYINSKGYAVIANIYPSCRILTSYYEQEITIDSTPAAGTLYSGQMDTQGLIQDISSALAQDRSIIIVDDAGLFILEAGYYHTFYSTGTDTWTFVTFGSEDIPSFQANLVIDSTTGNFTITQTTESSFDSSDTSTFLRHDGTWAVPSGGTGGVTITLNGTTTTTPSFYAPTGAGTSGYVLKSSGSGAPSWAAESDEKLKVAAATSGSSYNILLGSGLPAATRQISDEIQFIPGLSSGVQPDSTLYIGSAGNGQICFYTPVSKDKRYIYLKPASNGAAGSANALTVYLPYNSLVSGTQSHYLISALQRGTAIGGSTQSVYIDTNGVVTAGSTYAGGTAVTLNGTSAAASTASFYAPTTAGTSGYVLTSSGSGAPTWQPNSGGGGIVDSARSTSSTNALQNSVITNFTQTLPLPVYVTAGTSPTSAITCVVNSNSISGDKVMTQDGWIGTISTITEAGGIYSASATITGTNWMAPRQVTVGTTQYTITRKALEIVDGNTTTTYYVADITS